MEVETLVAGATLACGQRDGSISPETWEGVYHRDVRVLSRFALTVDGAAPPLLGAWREGAGTAQRVHVLATGESGSPTAVLLCRRSAAADAVRETWTVTVSPGGRSPGTLLLRVESDFALLQPVGHQVVARAPVAYDDGLRAEGGGFGLLLQPEGPQPDVRDGELSWTIEATPGRPWTAGIAFRPLDRGMPARPVPQTRAGPSLELATATTRWQPSVGSALADLEGLRVHVPDLGLSYLAAGAPWFMALFGRDTLLTAWSSLIAGTEPALGVVEALARFQGRRIDPASGEQPGRILHELRTGGTGVFGLPPGRPYYGTVDATPLFVALLAELARWGADGDRLTALLPAARAAVEWCRTYGDLDGDGYIEYAGDERGLANQGWKDAGDSMVHADGSPAPRPIALSEVQGYLYRAYLGLADLEELLGEPGRAPALRARAEDLRAAFARDFRLEGGLVAMALDGEKRPLAVASSNPGHCLWMGIVDDPAVAERLTATDLHSGWGMRTLGARERAFDPLSYHRGSVWPHDTAIGAAGLMRAGHVEGAMRLVEGLLDAAELFGWRLPELFGGFDRAEVPHPVPYPVTCSPQAWSAAAPLLLLRTAMRLEPDLPSGRVELAPALPATHELTVALPLGPGVLRLHVRGGAVEVLEAPPGISVLPPV